MVLSSPSLVTATCCEDCGSSESDCSSSTDCRFSGGGGGACFTCSNEIEVEMRVELEEVSLD